MKMRAHHPDLNDVVQLSVMRNMQAHECVRDI